MELTWLGTAGLILREGDAAIAFDPFGGMAPGDLRHPPAALPHEAEYRAIRHVFVTHGHIDHIYHLPRLYAGSDTTIYCTEAPARTLTRAGMPQKQLFSIGPGWHGDVGPFHIRAYRSCHCHFDLKLVLRTAFNGRSIRHLGHLIRFMWLDFHHPENGEILLYDITCGGTRLQVMGSMNLSGAVTYPTGADMLVLPCQGRSDLDTFTLNLIRRLRPKAVCLDHFDDSFPPITQRVDTSGVIRNIEKGFGIPCVELPLGSPVRLGKQYAYQGGETP